METPSSRSAPLVAVLGVIWIMNPDDAVRERVERLCERTGLAPLEAWELLRNRMHELVEASTEDTDTLARLAWGISEVDIEIARRLAEGES
jgi:hypothetical protein